MEELDEESSRDDSDDVDGLLKATRRHEYPEEKLGPDAGAQHLLNQLFFALLPEIEELIDFGEKHDS